MSIAGLLLGVINIAIVIVILLLIGAVILWFLDWIFKVQVPELVRRLFLGMVALIALYMLVALLLGMPTISLIDGVRR
jgi:hypothetical protein